MKEIVIRNKIYEITDEEYCQLCDDYYGFMEKFLSKQNEERQTEE